MKAKIRKIGEGIISLIYPNRCPYCDKLIQKDKYACEKCADRLNGVFLKRHAAGGYICYSPFAYTGIYAEAVKRFKFGGRCGYAKQLSLMVVCALLEQKHTGFDLITCVPMHKAGVRKRGYNQAKLLARECAKLMNIPYADTLIKIKNNAPQHRLKNAKERKDNVKGVYRVINHEVLKGKRVLIIDDIITSGSTLGECCRVLDTSGCESICCATVCTAVVG